MNYVGIGYFGWARSSTGYGGLVLVISVREIHPGEAGDTIDTMVATMVRKMPDGDLMIRDVPIPPKAWLQADNPSCAF